MLLPYCPSHTGNLATYAWNKMLFCCILDWKVFRANAFVAYCPSQPNTINFYQNEIKTDIQIVINCIFAVMCNWNLKVNIPCFILTIFQKHFWNGNKLRTAVLEQIDTSIWSSKQSPLTVPQREIKWNLKPKKLTLHWINRYASGILSILSMKS